MDHGPQQKLEKVMSRKLSLSTAALCAALLAIPLLPPPSDSTSMKRQTKSHRPTEGPRQPTPMNGTASYPSVGGALIPGRTPVPVPYAP
jgi:hypothetical protein